MEAVVRTIESARPSNLPRSRRKTSAAIVLVQFLCRASQGLFHDIGQKGEFAAVNGRGSPDSLQGVSNFVLVRSRHRGG